MTDNNRNRFMLRENLGEVFSAYEARESGVHGQTLKMLVDNGVVYKVERGLYSFDEFWDDELYVLQNRFTKGIYSHETALFLHGYSDRVPFKYDMTFPQGYNSRLLLECNVNVRHVKKENYNLGICVVKSEMGNEIKAYNIEKSLCDILRGKSSNIEIINSAMKKYAKSPERNIPLLLEYAEALRVKSKVMRYMEVLL